MENPALTETTYYILLSSIIRGMATASCRRPSSSPAEGYGWLPEPCTVP